MLRPQLDIKNAAAGPCSDCGTMVDRRIECVDGVTHSILDLCGSCWYAYRQRQAFWAECCG